MSAGKRKWRVRWWMWLIAVFICARYGILVMPRVSVFYSDEATVMIDYHWADNQSTYDGILPPGSYAIEAVDLVREAGYRVEFYWKPKGGRYHCISITPNWPRTVIYLDENADIDYSKGTDGELISKCPNDWADM
ncbi:hypothetical protein AX279_12310 [Pseudomonas sp. J237]|nr:MULTISPECIES: hypothetical protein [Pseudomonas]OEO25656.1 hypothetical protein AX279_12310 [Pseudomonas sp. J237]